MKKPALLLAAALCVYAADVAIDYAAEGKLWWAHVQYLASDEMQGRNVGTEEFRKAVAYVSAQFDRAGLKPAGTDGYQQPVRFETRTLIPDQSSLALVRNGEAQPLEMGADATLSARAELAPSVDAPMVFVGYGMVIPEARYDDLAGLDLRGKIAVYVSAAGPVEAPGNLKSHYSSGAERWAALRQAGAIGIATIMNPRTAAASGTPQNEDNASGNGRAGRGAPRPPQPAVVLADKKLSETAGEQIAIAITRRGGEKFFAGSGHSYDEILKLARDNQPLPHFPLQGTLRAKTAVKTAGMEASNVAGMLPGSDGKLKKEYVVMSAHLDHLGVGRPVNGDSIYNGAMDDASGVASVIEIARLMHAAGARPKRSILFLAVTAEEKGELGSRYFAAHPTVPARQIVADINLDMFLPLYPLKVIEVQGLAESTLGETVRAAAQESGVEVQSDREPEQNRFIRSDQYSFIRQGVPSLAFKFGYEFGSPEEKIRKDWVRDRYHKPSDDLDQPVDQAAAARFDRIILNLLERVANQEARPRWNDDSFFRRFAEAHR
jgi:hypothetical protein